MLKYDEWAVPGEVEYAERKAAEIEVRIERYHRDYEKSYSYAEFTLQLQFTEHVEGIFDIKQLYGIWMDYDITNEMLIGYFKSVGGCVDEPKMFDLPDDVIRSSLPEWDESLLPDDSWRDIKGRHSTQYMVTNAIEYLDGDWRTIKRKFNLSDAKCDRIMEIFVKKLSIKNKPVVFTE